MNSGLRIALGAVVAGAIALAALQVGGRFRPGARLAEAGPVREARAAKGEGDIVRVHVFNGTGELIGPIDMKKVVKTDKEWKAQLTPEQYQIARAKGTERPFCGTLLDNKQDGVYSCVCCGLPLFSSSSKFHSGTGWPSFFAPIAEGNVAEKTDTGFGMVRTEILCARCDAHLGHVFEDGPPPTGLRYCLNSESLVFTPAGELAKLADPAAGSNPRPVAGSAGS